MSKNQRLIDFLKSTGTAVNERAINDSPDLPALISMGDDKIFVSLFDQKNVVLFTVTADFSKMDLSQVFLLTNTALRFNSFKWGSPVQFCVDENEQYLYAWCTLSADNGNADTFLTAVDALISTNNAIRNSEDVNHNPLASEQEETSEEKQSV